MHVIRPIDLERDYPTIKSWYEGYGMTAPDKSMFSPVGFIATDLACVGILSTDSSYTFLEPLIGNPKAAKHERTEAVDHVVNVALDYCRALGKKSVHVLSNSKPVINREKQFGFEKVCELSMFRRSI
jgi:hypothetical protein